MLNTWTPTGAKVAVKAVEERAANKGIREALDVIAPELTKSKKIEALKSGLGKTEGILKTTSIQPGSKELEIAKAVEGIVKKSRPVTENISNLKKAIVDTADQLKQGVKDYDVFYNPKKLGEKLGGLMNSTERELTFAGDEAAEKAYQAAIDVFMKTAKKKSGLLSGLLDARKEFDRIAEKSLSGAFEKDAPKQLAFRDIRTAINNFIADHVPENVPVRDLLKKQSLMYDAIDNMAGREAKNVGKNAITKAVETIKKHPIITTGAGLYGAYQTGKHLGR